VHSIPLLPPQTYALQRSLAVPQSTRPYTREAICIRPFHVKMAGTVSLISSKSPPRTPPVKPCSSSTQGGCTRVSQQRTSSVSSLHLAKRRGYLYTAVSFSISYYIEYTSCKRPRHAHLPPATLALGKMNDGCPCGDQRFRSQPFLPDAISSQEQEPL
jgi:hypothetical protein